jgi:hypothetical protein
MDFPTLLIAFLGVIVGVPAAILYAWDLVDRIKQYRANKANQASPARRNHRIGGAFSALMRKMRGIHISWSHIGRAMFYLSRIALILLTLSVLVFGGGLLVQGVQTKGPLAFLGVNAPTPSPRITLVFTVSPSPSLTPTAATPTTTPTLRPTATPTPTSLPNYPPPPTSTPQGPVGNLYFVNQSNNAFPCQYDSTIGSPPYTESFGLQNPDNQYNQVTITWHLSSITDGRWSLNITSGTLTPGETIMLTATDTSNYLYPTGAEVDFYFTCQPCDPGPYSIGWSC